MARVGPQPPGGREPISGINKMHASTKHKYIINVFVFFLILVSVLVHY